MIEGWFTKIALFIDQERIYGAYFVFISKIKD